ncbi:TlpA family protein disulfide reductase [Sphingobacterium phlebotomi]|uniref:TlpA family protein disulfide reductase n=1 Tax=Sphingobacterium phlebotomi TaxID=2605433 RepID=A0A5D4GU14_9SPHI|nr:TlpA disulfide reductase family protein [Sphingobacterium phlebotomi]TYR32216.1 TlpA family protein disulfide reductase [Sphingobacterium phlebotomi]
MLVARLQFLLVLTLSLTLSGLAYGQDHVHLKINLTGIDKEKLVVHFDDGIVLDIVDLNQGDTTIIVDKPIYTSRPTISVVYDRKNFDEFFIDSNVAVLNLFYDANRGNAPFYTDSNTNLTAIYDTVSNDIYRELRRGQTSELQKVSDIYIKHGRAVRTNDSLKYELAKLAKSINAKSMDFLVPYAKDFFSFYYFKNQVLSFAKSVENDSEYYTTLLAYYNNTFPEEFRNTGEGKKIADELQQKISPVLLKEGETMPDIHFKDISGDTIVFKDQKENFVLLDFWASWCGPCIRQIPDIKALRKEFSADSLKIVGISIDRDSTSFINSIEEHKMDWVHSLDRGSLLSGKLGISSVPSVLLLDRNGKIVYYKKGGRLDMEKIRAIIRKD